MHCSNPLALYNMYKLECAGSFYQSNYRILLATNPRSPSSNEDDFMAIGSQDDALLELEKQLNRLHRSIRIAIQDYLKPMEGKRHRTLQENQKAVNQIQKLLERYGLRIQCPECGTPSILRVSPRKNAVDGVFVFDHKVNGKRTFHGGRTTLPLMRLVEKPARSAK